MAANVQWFVERLNETENQLNTTARFSTSDRASRAIEVMLKNIGHNLEAALTEWEGEVRNGPHPYSRIRVHDALRLLDRYNQLIAKSGVLVGPPSPFPNRSSWQRPRGKPWRGSSCRVGAAPLIGTRLRRKP